MTATDVTGPVTLVGTTNAGPLAGVDARGAVRALDGSWSLDWWVGADDRWHLPSDEAAVRQHLVEATPVVETAMRVPTGDAVVTVFGARVGGVDDDLIAVDVKNDSTLPFALALVLTGRSAVVVDGTRALIDGVTEVRFGRAPSRWTAGADADEVRAAVLGGEAGDDGAVGGRVVAVLFPLAHTARLRTTLTVAAGRPADPVVPDPTEGSSAVAASPEAEQVARGWRSQLDRGTAIRHPDDRLADATTLARAQVLLAAAGPPDGASVAELAALIRALARQGFGDEAQPLVVELATRQRLNGRFGRGPHADQDTAVALHAFGDHWRLTRDRTLADALVGPVAKAAHRIGKRGGDDAVAGALGAAVDLLVGTDQPDTAALVAALPGATASGDAASPAPPLDRLVDVAQADGSAADGAQYATAAVRLLRLLGAGVVDDEAPAGASAGIGIVLFGGFPAAWLGQGVEVHDAPTRHGLVSCAVRWHGERPALLWDRRPWPDAPPGEIVELSAPALDPTWRTTDLRGEALLSAPTPPDLEASFS